MKMRFRVQICGDVVCKGCQIGQISFELEQGTTLHKCIKCSKQLLSEQELRKLLPESLFNKRHVY